MALARFFNTIILFFLFSILVAQTPPANDKPSGEISLTVQSESCEGKSTNTEGTFANATHSGENFNNSDGSCVPNGNARKMTEPIDVWYKVQVPNIGSFKMYADGRSGSDVDETSLTAVFFTKSGDTYTRFDCINSSTADYEYEISNRTAGEMVYIQLFSNSELYGYNSGSDFLTFKFDICVFESSALDISENHTPMLSYYSNPVANRLAVESPYQIQTLRVFDLTGKEVLHKTPNQQKLSLHTYTLAPGAYLLRVETPAGQQTVKLIKK